jgi:hypothetical protein
VIIVKKILPFFVFSLLLAVPPVCLIFFNLQHLLVAHFWLLFGFVGGLTLMALTGVLLAQNGDPETYTQVFMGATVFKLLACLVFVLVYVINIQVNKTVFMLNLIYLYFLNTGFEIYVLLRNLRNQNLR